MTPKEKAEDLVNTYRIILMDEDTDCGEEILCSSIAIKNALVCVDEIIKACTNVSGHTMNKDYWEEVKIELNKL